MSEEREREERLQRRLKKRFENLSPDEVKISTPEGKKSIAEILAEKKQLESQVEDYQNKFQALSEEEYGKESEKFLEQLSRSGKFTTEQIDAVKENLSADTIETLQKAMLPEGFFPDEDDSKPPEQAPMGSVSLPERQAIPTISRGKRYKDEREMVRSLYWTAYYNKKSTPEEIEDAKQKLRTLWETVLTRTKQVNRENKPIEWDFTTWQCPKCLRHVINEPFCKCGFHMKREGGNYVTR